MSTLRHCARCKKAFWTRSYCTKCERIVTKKAAKRRKAEKVGAPEGAQPSPIPLEDEAMRAHDAQTPPPEAGEGVMGQPLK